VEDVDIDVLGTKNTTYIQHSSGLFININGKRIAERSLFDGKKGEYVFTESFRFVSRIRDLDRKIRLTIIFISESILGGNYIIL